MESKEYFEKVMQDYNQHRNGRSLRKYCKDEAIDYDWVIKFKKMVLRSPQGDVLEIKSTSLFVVAELLHKMS